MSGTESTHNESQPVSARDALIDRERVRGATRMIAEGTEALTSEEIHAIAGDVEIFIRNQKISRKELAKAVGYSPGVISEFLAGTYKGDNSTTACELRNWLNAEESRTAEPATTQFTWTNVAEDIKSTVGYCLDKKTIGLVYGPDTSGVGKTMALQAIHQLLGPRKSSLITIDKVDASPTGVIYKLCTALRISNTGRNRDRFHRIVEKLKGRSHIILIDQAHNLRGAEGDKPFYILTDIYDATKAAQLWCGTADLVAYLQRQTRKNADESLSQIARRIFPRTDLMESIRTGGSGGEPLVTIDQLKEMFAKNSMKLTSAGARFLCRLCNEPESGSVGLCVRIVEFATMLAERRNLTSLDVPILQEALRRGITLNSATLLMERTQTYSEPERTAKVG
jgi:DNA transposition AAA+ family ATPase